jgi:hypothetical protein
MQSPVFEGRMPAGPRVTVGMMDVALGSASAVSAVELDLLAVES